MPEEFVVTYFNQLAKEPRNETTEALCKNMVSQMLRRKTKGAVERTWKLPAFIVQNRPESDDCVRLLQELYELYLFGYHYSCVTMCGVVAERLLKDVARSSILVNKVGEAAPIRPSKEAFDQIEQIEIGSITRFLHKSGLISDAVKRNAESLAQLRNRYAHARGKNELQDSAKAIEHLFVIVDGTLAIFRDIPIKIFPGKTR